jgi:hypothetical protein
MSAPDDKRDLDRVTPLRDWYVRVGLPERSGRRLIASGNGPQLTQLTERPKAFASATTLRGSRAARRAARKCGNPHDAPSNIESRDSRVQRECGPAHPGRANGGPPARRS